ncbi:hypothetical protein [Ahrensia sp. 13_GOM-1096m]|uniref:hypothetical protein n=1 Tax=Ahrensia sp. 13_GOM-1096m TaxID=1380380 RepID=UPI000AF76AC5|nr:hypothetical protein [Ahrensia sp. 13_GOM-1096m]
MASPLTVDSLDMIHSSFEQRSAGQLPLRKRIAQQIRTLGPNMPVRGDVSPRSISPLY